MGFDRFTHRLMDWWHKIRRTWTALSSRIKLRKSGVVAGAGGGGGGGVEYGGNCGLLKLRDDVQMCGYRDVEVMWNMLSISLQHDQMEATKVKIPKPKHRSISRLFLWTNHAPQYKI